MEKVKIERRYSAGVNQQFGDNCPVVKEMMRRSLEVTRQSRRRYLVSGFMGNSVFVVTNVYPNGVRQLACLSQELPDKHRQTIKTGPLVSAGFHRFVLPGKAR